MPLTPLQQRFVDEYLIDGNATAAYRRAQPSVKSDAVAQAASSRLLSNVMIRDAIATARQKTAAAVEITRETVLRGFLTEANWYGDDSSASARVAALREIGKLQGYYPAEKHQVEHRGRLLIKRAVIHAANGAIAGRHGSNGRPASGTGGLLPE
jgi:phage terminase small subunit